MKKNGGSKQVDGFGSAPAPGFARAHGMPHDRQLKRPGPGAPDRGQTERPTKGPGAAAGHKMRQGGRRGDTGGGAKE